MKHKPVWSVTWILACIIAAGMIAIFVFSSKRQNPPTRKWLHRVGEYTSVNENARCFRCHAHARYPIPDPADTNRILWARMPANRIIDTIKYYTSNHWDFKCTDCHSDAYLQVPHPSGLRYAAMNTCLDCHEGDPATSGYHFEDVDTAFRKSVHFVMDSSGFGCWSCHDPHYNKAHSADTSVPLLQSVAYANAMCLKCHDSASGSNFFEYYGKVPVSIQSVHEWLPSMQNHFENVRCIDCHTLIRFGDSTLVSHQVLPAEQSLSQCEACHSANTILTHTLYRFRPAPSGNTLGFVNPLYLREQDIIGSNRNHYFLTVTAILLMITAGILLLHLIIRAILKTDRNGN